MSFNRISSHVAIGLSLLLLATPSFGQGPGGMQLFAPADVSTFGGDIEPNEGYFFQFDGLYWNISSPNASPVGAPGLTRNVSYGPHPLGPLDPLNDIVTQSNTLDTSDITSNYLVGARYEFGRVEDRNGWFCSIFQVRDEVDQASYDSADVVFNDPVIGPGSPNRLLQGPVGTDALGNTVIGNLPVTFYNVTLDHTFTTWGVELMYLHRNLTCHGGGTFEWFMGPRYIYIRDIFGVTTGSGPEGLTVPSFLGGSSWNAQAENNIIGGELGLRWFKKQGRWMFSTEGRFLAGLNRQNIHVNSDLGPNLNPGSGTLFNPSLMGKTTHNEQAYATEFSPAIELRLEGRYQVTRAVSLHAGWTGLWIDNIARGSAVIDYTVPAMGVDLSGNKQSILMNGLTLGLDINR